ncbi:MAG: hypothetical protein WBJ13_07020 [Sedimentibacter sp.]
MKNKLSINLEISLVEIILSVLIFAAAGVIMLNCFAIARFTQIKANDKVTAGNIVQSDLEFIKSSANSNEVDKYLLNTYSVRHNYENNQLYIKYYDKNWNLCDDDEKEYIIGLDVSNSQVNSGEMKSLSIMAEKTEPYPFINNDEGKTVLIYSIDTKKFFPNFNREAD